MPSVGQILAAERRRQGKSLHDAVEGTKIRSRLLQALEDDDYEHLPSAAYIKGYIQSYARYLEIPADPLLHQFRDEYGHRERAGSPTDRFLGMTPADLRQVPADTVVPRAEHAHAIPPRVWASIAGGVVVVLLVLCGISRACSGTEDRPLPKPADAGSVGAVTGSPAATAQVEPTTTVEQISSTFKLRVTVRVGQASWLSVTVDGLKAFEGTLADGESREWLVTQSATVKAGRPAVVTVTRDGAPVKLEAAGGLGTATLSTTQE